jgi:serine/threonine protein phosphatase PrpC
MNTRRSIMSKIQWSGQGSDWLRRRPSQSRSGPIRNPAEDGSSMTYDIRIEAAGVTDRGSVRADNQDQFFVAELTRCLNTISSSLALQEGTQLNGATLGHLLMVADGMGGHSAGVEASRLAVQYFIASILNRIRWLSPKSNPDESALIEDLKLILNQSHREIKRQSELDPDLTGMGTTFTMAYVIWPRMHIVHAGDTRCYLFRQGKLQLLTSDHTVAEHLMKSGRRRRRCRPSRDFCRRIGGPRHRPDVQRRAQQACRRSADPKHDHSESRAAGIVPSAC